MTKNKPTIKPEKEKALKQKEAARSKRAKNFPPKAKVSKIAKKEAIRQKRQEKYFTAKAEK